jgi:hypothetical protein
MISPRGRFRSGSRISPATKFGEEDRHERGSEGGEEAEGDRGSGTGGRGGARESSRLNDQTEPEPHQEKDRQDLGDHENILNGAARTDAETIDER